MLKRLLFILSVIGLSPVISHAQEGRITAILFLTGAASGLVYWLVAGRFGPRDGAV